VRNSSSCLSRVIREKLDRKKPYSIKLIFANIHLYFLLKFSVLSDIYNLKTDLLVVCVKHNSYFTNVQFTVSRYEDTDNIIFYFTL
jgi:hypothetical protein